MPIHQSCSNQYNARQYSCFQKTTRTTCIAGNIEIYTLTKNIGDIDLLC